LAPPPQAPKAATVAAAAAAAAAAGSAVGGAAKVVDLDLLDPSKAAEIRQKQEERRAAEARVRGAARGWG
jgi:Mrp family chromosome partitioning ATPase